MDPITQRLFDTYGESVLKDLDRFPDGELIDLLNALPLEESRRIDLFDKARHYYFQWSADAFVIGLHLGLSLLNNDVRRLRPEKV